ALVDAASHRENVVLATVMRITGSSYGGVGARMICLGDGSRVGLVSGGCLESDLGEHAKRVYATGCAEVVSYDTRDGDDVPWGLGLGCNGLIEVLLEPLSPHEAIEFAGLIDRALAADSPSVIATVIRSPDPDIGGPRVGSHALLDNGAVRSTGDWGAGSALFDATQYSSEALAAGRRGVVHEIGAAEVAFEVVMPAIRLVVCGAGPDAAPVARFASELGWDVTVVDHRPLTEAHSARFPGARVVECVDALQLARVLPSNQRFAAVVMSHNLARDRDYLYALLKSDLTYLGVLGPRARTERMLMELIAREGSLPHIDERFFSPVGLDIGGEGPDAIALSIISQISAVTSGRSGGHLRDRRAPLHAPSLVEAATGSF
ncbi:MAG: XshC-Cox1-family protein, partial [Gemmatimonadales bacterium]|nr:XshC-Cox1-family protein [Gemmatimonadales bacterium]